MIKIIKAKDRILVSDSLKTKIIKTLTMKNITLAHFKDSVSFYKDGLCIVLLLKDDEELDREVISLDGLCYRVKSLTCLENIL